MRITKEKKYKIDFRYIYFFAILVSLVLPLEILGFLEENVNIIINITDFLAIHTILEFASVVLCFIIFTTTYYTYKKIDRLRLLVLSCTFFVVGFLDFFHMMGYKGMPTFFTNSSIPKATTFWILSRLILALGLVISGIIPYNKTLKLKRSYFLLGSMIATYGIFHVIIFKIQWMPPMFIEGEGLTPLKILLEYIVMIFFVIGALFHIRDYKRTKDDMFLIMAMGLFLGVMAEAAFTLYKSVYDTYNMMGHFYKIASSFLIFKAVFIYNLDKPYLELRDARMQIKSHAQDLEKIVSQRTSEIQKVNEKMLQDLECAKRIQQSLLPPSELNIFGVKFISEYIPCEKLSGDFYHIHVIDDENIGMYIADVAGHGVSAAMMTVFADQVIKPVDISNRMIKKPSPHKTLAHFYKEFNKSDFPSEMHIVIFKAVYNIKRKILSYCSGGMNVLPMIIRKNGTVEMLDKSKGFPICKFGDFYLPTFQTAEVQLEEGDRVIFYTDGLVESFKSNTLLKKENLIKIAQNSINASLQGLNERILNEIKKNTKDLVHEDDITYFIMEA